MNIKNLVSIFTVLSISYAFNGQSSAVAKGNALTAQQQLGKRIFFDASLSEPAGQSCASCHNSNAGFALMQKKNLLPVSAGAIRHRFGNRNTPTVSYSAFVPALQYDKKEQMYVGGLFLDGRENSLESQAKGPLFNPVEMAIKNEKQLTQKLKNAGYITEFRKVFGDKAMQDSSKTLEQVTASLAAYQRSVELSPFTSKYDAYLNGQIQLSAQEQRGLEIFNAEDKGNCAACHISETDKDKDDKSGVPPLFTDFTYDNLGVPANKKNPFYSQPLKFNPYGKNYVDLGLGGIVKDAKQNGKFRVPTLRNIALTAPYMHNGVFETLNEVVDFYNTRDVKDWPKPEVDENVNKDELGDLKLTEQEVDDLVVFMKTLTDGYKVK